MAYSIEIQHLDGEWHPAGKLATFEGGVWVYPTFATKADAEAAIAATYGAVIAGSARIVSDDLNDRILAARAAGDWDLHEKLWEERKMASVETDEAQLADMHNETADDEGNIYGPPYASTVTYHGFCHRFCIRPFAARDGNTVFMVHDADHVTTEDIFAGHRSPVIAQLDSVEAAREYCDFVEAGKIQSVPHESNFVGWPELERRVKGR